jgi:hypothetical protein
LKKAHELAVLCDTEVALIIFSNIGKLFEFDSLGRYATREKKGKKEEDIAIPLNFPIISLLPLSLSLSQASISR